MSSGCFAKRYKKSDNTYIGLKYTKNEISERFHLILSKNPYIISDGIIYSGQIPRVTDFESQITPFIFENGDPDYVYDDSVLGLMLTDGLFVVTGCGHAGIVNTLEHIKHISGTNKNKGIMGGFHLKDPGKQVKETIRYLNNNNITSVYPSHCTSLPVLKLFYK